VAARYKAWIVFARSKAGIVDSNPTQGMDVCVCVYSVFVLYCVYAAALRRAGHSSKAQKDYETDEEARVQQRAVDSLMNEWMKFDMLLDKRNTLNRVKVICIRLSC
jgi:hypothetical protein